MTDDQTLPALTVADHAILSHGACAGCTDPDGGWVVWHNGPCPELEASA